MRAGMVMGVAGITRGARMIGIGVRAAVVTVVEHHKRGGFVRTGRCVGNGFVSAAVGVKVCRAVRRISKNWRKLGGAKSARPNRRELVKFRENLEDFTLERKKCRSWREGCAVGRSRPAHARGGEFSASDVALKHHQVVLRRHRLSAKTLLGSVEGVV